MIAIVCSEFNSKVTDGLLEGCLLALNKDGVSSEKIDIHKVPGAFELPGKVKRLTRGDTSYDAIITLGCVIKGETDHYHYISQAVTDGIMSLTIELDSDYPKIIFGVLTCQSKELAIARSGSNMDKNKGYEAGKAALKMISTKKD